MTEKKPKASWRKNPDWRLVSWDPSFWTSAPEQPTKEAELCGEGWWASVFNDSRVVATWFRG